MVAPLCPHPCDQRHQSVIRAQIPNILRTESFLPPQLLQAVCKLLQEHLLCCIRGGRWVYATVLRAKWTEFNLPGFPWKLQSFHRLHSPQVFKTGSFCQQNCCLGRRQMPNAFYSAIFPEFFSFIKLLDLTLWLCLWLNVVSSHSSTNFNQVSLVSGNIYCIPESSSFFL